MICKRLFRPRAVPQTDTAIAELNIVARNRALHLLSTRVDELWGELAGAPSPPQPPVLVQQFTPPQPLRNLQAQPPPPVGEHNWRRQSPRPSQGSVNYTISEQAPTLASRSPTRTRDYTSISSPRVPVTCSQNTRAQLWQQQPPIPSNQPATRTRSSPRNARPSRNIPLPTISPTLSPASFDEPVPFVQPRIDTNQAKDVLYTSSGLLLKFPIIEQTFPREPSALFAGTKSYPDSPMECIEKEHLRALAKLQKCINRIGQENLDTEGCRRCRDHLLELQHLLHERSEYLDGPNAARFKLRMQFFNQALKGLANQLHEAHTKADLEAYCMELLPSFESFARVSESWLCCR